MNQFKAPNWILRYLISRGRGDQIEVSVMCNETESRPPRLIITYPNNNHWASCKTRDFNQYIQVKLMHKVFISGYAFERWERFPGVYMMNWRFLGSVDGNEWSLLDEHVNDSIFSNTYAIRPNVKKGVYNYFRILNTGLNHYDNLSDTNIVRTILYMRYLDLYGVICYNDQCSIQKKKTKFPYFIWLILNSK